MSHETWANDLLGKMDWSDMQPSEQLLAASVVANSIACKFATKASGHALICAITEMKETLAHVERALLDRLLNAQKEKTP